MSNAKFNPCTIDELLVAKNKIAVTAAALSTLHSKDHETLLDGLYIVLTEAQENLEKALDMLAPLEDALLPQPIVAPPPAPVAPAKADPDDDDDDMPTIYEWPADKPLPERYHDGSMAMIDEAPTTTKKQRRKAA